MLPALITGGSAILGGLIQNRAAKKQQQRQYEYDKQTEARQQALMQNTEESRFKWLVKGAQDAGFNPLTVLGATGGAMGNSPSAAGRSAPLSQIGNTLARAGQQFASMMPDPITQQTRRLENQLLQKQITQIDRENLRYGQPRTIQTNSPTTVRIGGPIDPSRRETPLYDDYLTGDNRPSVEIPTGADLGEAVMGAVISATATQKKKNQFRRGRKHYQQSVIDARTRKLQGLAKNNTPTWVR